ncbi:MAG: hypothetical protein A7315_01685 [Candidatus Altiarchaeales archaeon WOR_SM1_79]|nr:MAG: hypothetical protein A7315_01685 [Candidatus Altiarchaeales archaeon WOR_SM1_79]
MDPLSQLGEGGNAKNPLNPGLPYIIGENPPPILEEEKGLIEGGEIPGNRTAEAAIFQVKGSEPGLINGRPLVHIVSPLHELKHPGIVHQFDSGLGVIPPNGPESGKAEDEIAQTSLMDHQYLFRLFPLHVQVFHKIVEKSVDNPVLYECKYFKIRKI